MSVLGLFYVALIFGGVVAAMFAPGAVRSVVGRRKPPSLDPVASRLAGLRDRFAIDDEYSVERLEEDVERVLRGEAVAFSRPFAFSDAPGRIIEYRRLREHMERRRVVVPDGSDVADMTGAQRRAWIAERLAQSDSGRPYVKRGDLIFYGDGEVRRV